METTMSQPSRKRAETEAALRSLKPLDEDHLEFAQRTPVWVQLVRWGLIVLALLVLAYVAQQLIEAGHWLMVSLTAFVAICIVAVYATRRAIRAEVPAAGCAAHARAADLAAPLHGEHVVHQLRCGPPLQQGGVDRLDRGQLGP
ncbi:hypothetical protein [Ornithinimicrobium flavum]|uniref:hypothetical protein n=1 Tax=Ornithinimicrobium flavum TaxID=1288636 RepID=UPI001EE990E2|nr:hypothetical protein [Ornithinimicrobium flavum]